MQNENAEFKKNVLSSQIDLSKFELATEEEIEQVVIPIIDFKKQEQIAKLVEESFKLKVESERLLEVAKKAVEIAIEENEAIAIKFIKDNN